MVSGEWGWVGGVSKCETVFGAVGDQADQADGG